MSGGVKVTELIVAAASLCIAMAGSAVAGPPVPTPPAQPVKGPGGSEMVYPTIEAGVHGKGDTEYWLFEPKEARTPLAPALPVIVFNHGWGGVSPSLYLSWIEHLVHRGNIVIFPRYQEDISTRPYKFGPNAVAAVKDALARLKTEKGHAKPDLMKLAVVGHSAGGQISPYIAVNAVRSGLPPFAAVMAVEPGRSWGAPMASVPLEDLDQLPAKTLLLTITGDTDHTVGTTDARRMIDESTRVPAQNKNMVSYVTDARGEPPLLAHHFFPLCPLSKSKRAAEPDSTGRSSYRQTLRSTDALDYCGIWKLFDGLTDAAFFGKNREYALGNTPQQRDLGTWSDGVPVKKPHVYVPGTKANSQR